MQISVVVCCYNSESRIAETLDHLARQQFAEQLDWEVLLIDNNSTDDTARKSTEVWKASGTPVSLRVVLEEEQGLIHAKKRGLEESGADIVVFCDDDNWLAPDFLSRVWDFFENHEEAGVLGGEGIAEFWETKPPEWFSRYSEAYAVGRPFDELTNITEGKAFVWGAGMAIRRECWLKLKACGYEFLSLGRAGKKLSSGEDSELCYAIKNLGYQIWFDPNIKYRHVMFEGRLQWSYLRKLYRAFADNYPIKSAYDHAFEDPNGEKDHWKAEFQQVARKLRKKPLKFLKPLWLGAEGEDMVIRAEFQWAKFKALWRYRHTYNEIIRDLVKRRTSR